MQQNPNLNFSIEDIPGFGVLFVVLAKTPRKKCIIVLNLMFLDFKFFPRLEHENSVPTPFWNPSLGFMFKTLS